MKISEDVAEFLFRSLFCLIFIGLGGEHLFSDNLIQHLMPEWVPMKRLISILCGMWLLGWGTVIFLGVKVRLAATALGIFLVIVTIFVHVPGILHTPSNISPENAWLWTVLQRSNLARIYVY